MMLNNGWSLAGQYDAQLGNDFTAHLVTARFRYAW